MTILKIVGDCDKTMSLDEKHKILDKIKKIAIKCEVLDANDPMERELKIKNLNKLKEIYEILKR